MAEDILAQVRIRVFSNGSRRLSLECRPEIRAFDGRLVVEPHSGEGV